MQHSYYIPETWNLFRKQVRDSRCGTRFKLWRRDQERRGREGCHMSYINAAASNFETRSNFKGRLSDEKFACTIAAEDVSNFSTGKNFKVTWKGSNTGTTVPVSALPTKQPSKRYFFPITPSHHPLFPVFYKINWRRTNTPLARKKIEFVENFFKKE